MKQIIILILLSIICLSSCTLFQSGSDQIIDYLPRNSDVPGWTIEGEIALVSGSEVESYNADYSQAGIDQLAHADYVYFEDNGRVIRVEIIKFNSVLSSYSFFSDIRGLGDTGKCSEDEFFNDSTAMIRAGEYIILARIEKQDIANIKDLKDFSMIAKSYIGDRFSAEKLPPVANILKRSGAECVLYSRKNIDHIPGINRIYYAMIIEGEKKYYVFLSDRESYYRSMNIFQKIISRKFIIIKADNTQGAFIKESSGSYLFVSVYDRWIYGCWGVSDINDGKRILTNIKNVIEGYSKNSQ